MISRQVELVNVTLEEAQAATQAFQSITNKHGMSDDERDVIWKSAQICITYALLEEGKIPGSMDGDPLNGRYQT